VPPRRGRWWRTRSAGFVDSLAKPGGNVTGFMIYEYSLSGKWLEMLKEVAPNVTRAAVIRNPENPVGVALFSAIQAQAQSHVQRKITAMQTGP
jgi:putative ABC transport system substrate-binding protein